MTIERSIDTFELARAGARLSGECPVADMKRLAVLLSDAHGTLSWQLHGWRAPRPQGGADDFMSLAIRVAVRMPCVRCNGPVQLELSIDRSYRMVGSEAEAERLDLDDPDYDVLAAGQHFDHLALIEDEAIMAVPPTPRHQRCELPVTVPLPGTAAIEPTGKSGRRNPFAALARLKNGSQNTDIIED